MIMSSIVKSTGIVAISTLASRILGFGRDMLFSNFFGATGSADAFFVAFRIPNLLRRFVAEGALTISFIPVYSEYLVKKSESEALELAQKTFSFLMLIVLILVTAGMVFSAQIVSVMAMGFDDPAVTSLTVNMTRIMFPYLGFVSFVAFSMGILNSHGYFFAPAFSPVLLNAGMITGIIFFCSYFDEPVYGVTAGVLFGGIMQLLLQIPYLVKSGFRLKISFDTKHPGIRKIGKLVLPAIFGGGIYQINIFMGTILASMLSPGSISYLYYSDRLTEIVLGVFIVSIGNVILPEMSRMTASDDYDKLKKLYSTSLRAALFLAVPAAMALMTVGLPVISVMFMRGEFSFYDASMTSRALFYSSIGVSSVAVLRITTPVFYSLKDIRTPVLTSIIAFVLNISLGYLLMHTRLHHAGLSLANSISVTVQIIILIYIINRKIGGIDLKGVFAALFRFIAAGCVMCVAVYYIALPVCWESMGLGVRVPVLAAIVVAGALVYYVMCRLLGVKEAAFIAERVKRLKK